MTSATAYHHGDLPNALRCAAVDVIDERGLGSFSLREVARRAGVSHTAPAHHFGDMRGLLTSVAIEGFEALHRATTDASAGIDDPVERLAAIGQAYVQLGQSNHAHCEVMFRTDVVDPDDDRLRDAGMQAYSVVEGAIQAIIDGERLPVDIDEATWFCWSTMQGLVTLEPKISLISEMKTGKPASVTHLVNQFTAMIVAGLRNSSDTA